MTEETTRTKKFHRKLVDERHMLRAFAHQIRFGDLIDEWNIPGDRGAMRAKEAHIASRCARCGQWMKAGEYITKCYFKREPELKLWAHKLCPDLFDSSEWISGADYDYITQILRGVDGSCHRCGVRVVNGDIYYVLKNAGSLFVNHVCKECVKR